MTCKDCIHYQKENEYCDSFDANVRKGDGYDCPNYADRDGLYSNGTWHCPRCGKPVDVWGLCNECEEVYLTHNSVENALDALDSCWDEVSK